MRATYVAAALATLTLTAACGPYIDEVNAQHREKVEAKLEEVGAVGRQLAATPILSQDADPDAEIGIVLSDTYGAKGNAALLYAEDFANLDELGFVYARLPDADLVQRCSAAIHTEHLPWNPARAQTIPGGAFGSSASRWYQLLEELQYVAVLRTRAFAKPEGGVRADTASVAAADGGAAGDAGTTRDAGTARDAGATRDAGSASQLATTGFSGGYLSAEVLFFRLEGPKYVGGIRFEAESSLELKGSMSEVALETNLRANIELALVAALAGHAPRVKVNK